MGVPRDDHTVATGEGRPRLSAEVLIVLGLSLGQSGVYAVMRLIARLTDPTPLAAQTAALNNSASDRGWLDVVYQLLGFGFAVVPVVLALYLLAVRPVVGARVGHAADAADADPPGPAAGAGRDSGIGPFRWAARSLGFDLTRPWHDVGWGAALAAAIGIPGIGFYLLGRAMGITVHVSTANLGEHWWTIPILVLSAATNGVLEEVVVVAYFTERLSQLRWAPWAIVLVSAVLRGSYHLYQGIGPFLGNVAMGVVFAWYYWRTRRVMPLVVAHTLMDVVAFVGPSLIPTPWLT